MHANLPDGLVRHLELQSRARAMLGDRAFSLLQSYGKLMAGRYSGRYVNAIPAAEQLNLAQRLIHGDVLPVHLMHRHRSGNYESSSLRWVDRRLIMVFNDREEWA